jgi:uncharacterized protein (TIGR04255 family)
MAGKSEQLPKFDRPPVVEVALVVQFPSIKGFTAAHLGLIWQHFRERFPKVEQHAPINNRVERTGIRPIQTARLAFTAGEELVPRIWMVTQDQSQLIQIQSDRFVRNWRRYHDRSLDYPTFADQIRPAFVREFDEFRMLVTKLGLGDLNVDQCEVTYVNQVRKNEVWSDHSQLDRVFVGWSSKLPRLEDQLAESIACRANYQIIDQDKFVGRLFIEIDSQFVAEKTNGSPQTDFLPIFNMNLVARGQPIGEGNEGVMQFIDLGHEVIVRSFAKVTTKEMHATWGRTQ